MQKGGINLPKQTFYNLSTEKQKKIIKSARKEFSRVPLAEASIQNIVQDADIARGSFYQYFEDKEDLFEYIVEEVAINLIKKFNSKLSECKDIFETYIFIYDEMVRNQGIDRNRKFCQMFFRNTKPDDKILEHIRKKIIEIRQANFEEIIEKSKLDLSKKDIRLFIKMVNSITVQSIAEALNSTENNKQEKRNNFLQELNFVKYGVYHKEKKEG